MRIKIGEIEALFRYPVKSMGGESLEKADMGWHGLDGDRRLARARDNKAGVYAAVTRRGRLSVGQPIFLDV